MYWVSFTSEFVDLNHSSRSLDLKTGLGKAQRPQLPHCKTRPGSAVSCLPLSHFAPLPRMVLHQLRFHSAADIRNLRMDWTFYNSSQLHTTCELPRKKKNSKKFSPALSPNSKSTHRRCADIQIFPWNSGAVRRTAEPKLKIHLLEWKLWKNQSSESALQLTTVCLERRSYSSSSSLLFSLHPFNIQNNSSLITYLHSISHLTYRKKALLLRETNKHTPVFVPGTFGGLRHLFIFTPTWGTPF